MGIGTDEATLEGGVMAYKVPNYRLAKHTGENMIFPYWEIDQDRRCRRNGNSTVWWPEYASPIVPNFQ